MAPAHETQDPHEDHEDQEEDGNARRNWRRTALRVRSSVRFRLMQRWNHAAIQFEQALAEDATQSGSLADYEKLGVLGEGGAAVVYLVRHRASRLLYAMKVQSCPLEQPWARRTFHARKEQYILKMLQHPFICELHEAFHDSKRLYLVLAFQQGGSLHDVREFCGGSLSEKAVQFYVSEVIQALEFVHTMGLVYRDLKPQNVLIASDGHIRLTDFGVAHEGMPVDPSGYYGVQDLKPWLQDSISLKDSHAEDIAASTDTTVSVSEGSPCLEELDFWKDDSGMEGGEDEELVPTAFSGVDDRVRLRSNSFVGALDYMPPEMIQQVASQSTDVDWWALGCLMYELLYGVPPFQRQDDSSTKSVFRRILSGKLIFPSSPRVSDSSKDLIRSLLAVEPQHRLGHRQGSSEIKAHGFFQSTQWALLRNQQPPVKVRRSCEQCWTTMCPQTSTTEVSTTEDDDDSVWHQWLQNSSSPEAGSCDCSIGEGRYERPAPVVSRFQAFVRTQSQRFTSLDFDKILPSIRKDEPCQLVSTTVGQGIL